MDLVTYHGDADLKAAFLYEIGKHEAADAIIKGTYAQMNSHFQGCAIGCSLYSLSVLQGQSPAVAAQRTGEHARIPTELGWPLWLAYAEDTIFENLPDALSKTWPRRLAEAIPVGVTVPDLVLAKLLRWMLVDEHFGVVKYADTKVTKNAVLAIAALFDRTIGGDTVPESEWAAGAAWTRRAAWAAWTTWAVGTAGAAVATRAAFYPVLSEELLRLLRELEPASAFSVTA